MPILHVRALPQKDPSKITQALKSTAIAISKEYGCSEKQVWVTWEEIKSGHYVEGGSEVSEQHLSTHPPICELTCFEGRSSEDIESLLKATALTLSGELGILNNIFITYREAKSGQVISGNGIIRNK